MGHFKGVPTLIQTLQGCSNPYTQNSQSQSTQYLTIQILQLSIQISKKRNDKLSHQSTLVILTRFIQYSESLV